MVKHILIEYGNVETQLKEKSVVKPHLRNW